MNLHSQAKLDLTPTTQGPLYPPSEICDGEGNFVVVGRICDGHGGPDWGGAIVSPHTIPPAFGEAGRYDILRRFDPTNPPADLADEVLWTLPLPLACNNYPMLFAPKQAPDAHHTRRASAPLHTAYVPDARPEDGLREIAPITLGNWLKAKGKLEVSLSADRRKALFEMEFSHLVPNSVYTVMSLRQHDLRPEAPTRPGPLGIPNVFITDGHGNGQFEAVLPDPFPDPSRPGANRIINVILLYMSTRMSYGGAIGLHGLGADIHAQLKLTEPAFSDLVTVA
ncbi:hypothetical protein [Celeribacter sp.]|uniref:hypothetical protein n=1 Tax=Celeribacter sp. TaxID=1890673 RepID=UPI003A93DF60